MTDHTLKKLFSELKRHDVENAPKFHRMTARRAPAANQSLALAWMPFALLAALLIAAALIAFSVLPKSEGHTAAEVAQWESITEWTASSDAILAANTPSIGVSFSTSSDLLFESSSISTSPNKNQNL